jgi:hypothetical protein
MKANVVELTANAILQNPIKINVNGQEYNVAPPSTATLIEVSKYIASLPTINVSGGDNILSEVLAEALNCDYIGNITAILVLGKKNLVSEKKYLFGLITRKVDNVSKLSKELLENLTPADLNTMVIKILKTLDVDFFFSILTFLKSINQIRTKSQTTVSGQPLQE